MIINQPNGTNITDSGIFEDLMQNHMKFITGTSCLRVFNILLHTLGSWLMVSLFRAGILRSVQTLFVIHLSIVEAMSNAVTLSYQVIDVYFHNAFEAVLYLDHMIGAAQDLMYYMSMYYLTLDRLIAIRLNIKYQSCCTVRRTKWLLAFTWLISLMICAALITIYILEGKIWYKLPYTNYINLGFSSIYVIIAVTTYITLFIHLINSSQFQTQNNSNASISIVQVFRRSNFHIPILLITTFLLMVIVPDLVYLTALQDANFTENISLVYALEILSVSSDTVDALIYIFLIEKVRRLLFKKLKLLFCCLRCTELRSNQRAVSTYSESSTTIM